MYWSLDGCLIQLRTRGFFPSSSTIHSISFHLKAGSLMAAMILGVKQLPKKRRQFFPGCLFLWVRTLYFILLESSPNVSLSSVGVKSSPFLNQRAPREWITPTQCRFNPGTAISLPETHDYKEKGGMLMQKWSPFSKELVMVGKTVYYKASRL